MDAKETIQKLKVLLGMEKPVEETVETPAQEEKFEAVKLANGSEVNVDVLEVGGKVTVQDEEGNEVAANGEHILEDGRTIVVTDGVISEIKEVEVEEAPAEEMEEETPAEEVPETPSVEDRVANLEGQIGEIMQILEGIMGQFNKQEENFNKKLEEFGKETLDQPAQFKQVEKNFEDMTKFEQFMYLRKQK